LPQRQRCPTNLQFNSAPQNRTIFEDAREDPKEGEARSRQKMGPSVEEGAGSGDPIGEDLIGLFSFGKDAGLGLQLQGD